MSSKTQRLQKYMLHKIINLEGNMLQGAIVDNYLGEEHMLRAQQVKAIKDDDTDTAVAIHDKRIACLEKALKELRTCPGCERHDHEVDQ